MWLKVLRDFRHKQSSAGQPMTFKEAESYQAQLWQFFSSKRGTGEQKKAATKANTATQPRIATLDWLRTLEHSMYQATGKTLKSFDNNALLATVGVQGEIVKIPTGPAVMFEDNCPNLLSISTDRQSTQLCGVHFLLFKLRLNVTYICDPAHSNWRSILDGLQAAGLLSVVHVTEVIYNIAYGPLQKSAFFKYLKESSQDISANMHHNDPLLLLLWPRIFEELDWDEDDRGHTGRVKFLKLLPTLAPGDTKGPKASKGRFYSFAGAFRTWDSTTHTKVLLIAYTAIRCGWVKSFRQMFDQDFGGGHGHRSALVGGAPPPASASYAVGIATAVKAAPAEAPSSSAANTGASSSSGAPAASSSAAPQSITAASGSVSAAPGTSQAESKLQAKALADKERGKSQNTFHAVGRLLSNATLLRQVRMVGLATNDLALKYGMAYKEMKGVDATIQWYAGWSHWSVCNPPQHLVAW